MVHGAGWFWSWWHNMISMMIATIMVFDGWQARHPLVRYYGPTCLLADHRLLLSYHCDTDNGDGGGDDVDGDHHHHPIHPIGFHWWELSWENYLSVWLPAETASGWLVIFKSSQKLRRYFVAYIYLSSRICPLSFDICQVIIATPIGHFSWALEIPLIDEILCKQ